MSARDFEPLTIQIGIQGTSYRIQLGMINGKWAIKLLRGKETVAVGVFENINKNKLPEKNKLVNWIRETIPLAINIASVVKAIEFLLKQAKKNKDKKKPQIPITEAKKVIENRTQKDRQRERVVIFIDNSNIFKGFQKHVIKVDYEKLKVIITGGRDLQAIYLYEGVVYPINPAKKKWYDNLSEKSGYVVKASFDKMTDSERTEKKVDIQIAIDVISQSYENAYNTAILVSGDGDFLPVIKKVKGSGKKIEIWAFKYSLAHVITEELNEDSIFYLDDYLEDLKI